MISLDFFFASVKLPSMPEVAHQLIKTLNNDYVAVKEVRDIIANDPALTVKLLRLANSAQFGLQRGVSSLDEAIQMVGMSKVRSLSLAACMSETFPALPGLSSQEFWQNSTACAGYAQWLAGVLLMDTQLAWLTGMMLRLGELLIGQADPEALAEIEKLPHLPGSRWEREKRLIGFSEGEITAELARRWNFPMQICQALERAYDPLVDQAFSRLGAVLHLAGILADVPNATAESVDYLPQDVIAKLSLKVQWLKDTLPGRGSFIRVS